MSRWSVLVLTAALAACAAAPARQDPPPAQEGQSQDQAKQMYADLIRSMLAQGQYYAALAHLEEQKRRGPLSDDLRFLEAEALRKLGRRTEAEAAYRPLLKTFYVGQAYHGLGLLNTQTDLGLAVVQLQQAADRLPTDVEVRNDLGYALMVSGRYPEALPELATAVELDPKSAKSRNNLILLLILMRDEASVQRMVREAGISAEQLADLRRQAQSFKTQPKAAPGTGRRTSPPGG